MDVLCVGHASWDINLFLDGFPPENSKCEIRTMLECGGGPAANAAYLLSRWSVSCGIAAAIGDDAYGRRIIDEFLAVGADVSLLERSPDHPTPVSVILVNRAFRQPDHREPQGHPPGHVAAAAGAIGAA